MIRINHVLVATDFSEASDRSLEYGRELARTFGGTLHVLHVADNLLMRLGPDGGMLLPMEVQTGLEAAARERLEGMLGPDDRRELHAEPMVLTSSSPAEAIVSYATQIGADVIVVGTHGRRALVRMLLGSVAERVVRTAPCPVLTVHNPEHEFLIPDALVATSRATAHG